MHTGKPVDKLKLDSGWAGRQIPTTSELVTAMAQCPRVNQLLLLGIPSKMLIPLLQSLVSVAKRLGSLHIALERRQDFQISVATALSGLLFEATALETISMTGFNFRDNIADLLMPGMSNPRVGFCLQ